MLAQPTCTARTQFHLCIIRVVCCKSGMPGRQPCRARRAQRRTSRRTGRASSRCGAGRRPSAGWPRLRPGRPDGPARRERWSLTVARLKCTEDTPSRPQHGCTHTLLRISSMTGSSNTEGTRVLRKTCTVNRSALGKWVWPCNLLIMRVVEKNMHRHTDERC